MEIDSKNPTNFLKVKKRFTNTEEAEANRRSYRVYNTGGIISWMKIEKVALIIFMLLLFSTIVTAISFRDELKLKRDPLNYLYPSEEILNAQMGGGLLGGGNPQEEALIGQQMFLQNKIDYLNELLSETTNPLAIMILESEISRLEKDLGEIT